MGKWSERGSFIGRAFRPQMPKIRRTDDTLRVTEQWRILQSGLSRNEMQCPNDGERLRLFDLIDDKLVEQSESGQRSQSVELIAYPDTAHLALGCDKCGYHVTVNHLLDEAQQHVPVLHRAERKSMIVGIATPFLFGIMAVATGNLITVLYGLLFGMMFLMRALIFRYRNYLIVQRRVFSQKPSLGEWLRFELNRT
tara:strand:- start:4258 stop:4845 length:588 start_codon:yes stop_codon:yes gene_type:complete